MGMGTFVWHPLLYHALGMDAGIPAGMGMDVSAATQEYTHAVVYHHIEK